MGLYGLSIVEEFDDEIKVPVYFVIDRISEDVIGPFLSYEDALEALAIMKALKYLKIETQKNAKKSSKLDEKEMLLSGKLGKLKCAAEASVAALSENSSPEF